MSASLLSFLSIVLAFVGGLALGWFGRKLSGAEFSQSDIDDAYVRASRSVTVDVEGCRAAAFREASQEADWSLAPPRSPMARKVPNEVGRRGARNA